MTYCLDPYRPRCAHNTCGMGRTHTPDTPGAFSAAEPRPEPGQLKWTAALEPESTARVVSVAADVVRRMRDRRDIEAAYADAPITPIGVTACLPDFMPRNRSDRQVGARLSGAQNCQLPAIPRHSRAADSQRDCIFYAPPPFR